MAVRIVKPSTSIIQRGSTAHLTIQWTPEYPQTAYEIMYRRKDETAWSTFGRNITSDNSAPLDLAAFADNVEYYYRVVCYSRNAIAGGTIYDGSDISETKSLVVIPVGSWDRPTIEPNKEVPSTYMRVDTPQLYHYSYFITGYNKKGPVETGTYYWRYTRYYEGSDKMYKYGTTSYLVVNVVSSYAYKYDKTYHAGHYVSGYNYRYDRTYYVGECPNGYMTGVMEYTEGQYCYREMRFLAPGGYARVYEVDFSGAQLWYYRYRTVNRNWYRGFDKRYYEDNGYQYIQSQAYIPTGWYRLNFGPFMPASGYVSDRVFRLLDKGTKEYTNQLYKKYYMYYRYTYPSDYMSYYGYYMYAYVSGYEKIYGYMRYTYMVAYNRVYGYYRTNVPMYEYYYVRYQTGPHEDDKYGYTRQYIVV